MSTATSADTIQVTLPDGSVQEVRRGTTVEQVAASIGRRLARDAVAGKVNGRLVDVYYPLAEDCRLEVVVPPSADALEVYRHTTSHILANAVKELWPDVQIGVGPVIDDGFYYDFRRDQPFTEQDLAAIERRMQEIIDRDNPVRREEWTKDDAIRFFAGWNDDLKVELIREKVEGDVASCYRQGEFVDFCRGPHLPSTGRVKAFKLTGVSGAYWKGDQANQQLQRIYGTSFFTKPELEEHLRLREEAKERDHRKLGRELDLFSFHPEAPASPFFHPKGALVYNLLIDHVRGLYRRYGYQEVITPQIFDASLWHRSGHYENYRDHMYFTRVEDREFAVKPMNCPSHVLIYRTSRHSYRDLPLRLADFGRLHRYELSGATAGLTRVRSFSQDDAHIFCTPEQIGPEVVSVAEMILETYGLFDFETKIRLATRPEKAMGEPQSWAKAEAALAAALDGHGVAYEMDPGGGAFYGPKVDFHVQDALRRYHQLGTIQLDYQLPERFDLRYVAASGADERTVMIHRAMLGSLERFLGILIEHLGGAFPPWLAPVQVAVLPITERALAYAEETAAKIAAAGGRVEVDRRQEKIGFKIREAQMGKVPAMLVVGDREASSGLVALRTRRGGDRGTIELGAFLGLLERAVKQHSREIPEE
jgi:threonyl-tRNA synthetase